MPINTQDISNEVENNNNSGNNSGQSTPQASDSTDSNNVNPNRGGQNSQTRSGNSRGSRNSRSRARQSRSSAFSTSNHSSVVVQKKFFNTNSITEPFIEVKTRDINIKYTVRPIKDRLEAQAWSFAQRVQSDYKNYLKDVLGSRTEYWQYKLERAYIYSYYKCLLYSTMRGRIAELPDNTYVMIGHQILYHALQVPVRMFNINDMRVSYILDFSDEDLDFALNEAKKYDFISDYLGESPRFFLQNSSLDRLLQGLFEQIISGYPKVVKFYDEWRLSETYLSVDNFALLNSFYTPSSKLDHWYYAFSEKNSILEESSLLGKALFVTCKETNEIDKYFESVEADDKFYLTQYELKAIAGSDYPSFKKPNNRNIGYMGKS